MWILCRYKYIISHNILDHISILMAREYFGSLPIISVSQGHFSRTDMAASRDRDLVKMQEIRNTKFEPKILSLLSNRFQVGLRENPHGKIFQNWSLDCYHKINPILDVSKRSRAKLFYFRKIPILNFLNSQWSVFRDPLSRWCVQTVDSWDQQFLSGEGRGAQRTQENTDPQIQIRKIQIQVQCRYDYKQQGGFSGHYSALQCTENLRFSLKKKNL